MLNSPSDRRTAALLIELHMSWRGTTLGYFNAVSQNYLSRRGISGVDPDNVSKGRIEYSSGEHKSF